MAYADVAQIGCYINRTYTFARPCVLRLAPEWMSVTLTPDGRHLSVDGVPKLQHMGTHRIVVQECGLGVPTAPERPVDDGAPRGVGAGVGGPRGGSDGSGAPVVVGFGSGERNEYHVLEIHVVPTRLHKCCGLVASVAVALAVALYVWTSLYGVVPDGDAVPAVTLKVPHASDGSARVRIPDGVAVGDIHHGPLHVDEADTSASRGVGATAVAGQQGTGAAAAPSVSGSKAALTAERAADQAAQAVGGSDAGQARYGTTGEPINPHVPRR